MIDYPFLTEQQLTETLISRRDAFARNGNSFPQWLDAAPADLLKRRKFIVCGSICRTEIRALAANAEIVGIVDDILAKTARTLFGVPVLTSDQWVRMASADSNIVSCILVPTFRAWQHFSKLAAQFHLKALYPLQFLHVLKTAGISITSEAGRFFWYGDEFFQSTQNNLDKLLQLGLGLADEYSRVSWLSILAYRLTLNPFYLEACAVGPCVDDFQLNSYVSNAQFFDFSDQEIMVDGGAFTGDTMQTFIHAVNGRFKHIHTFEPSSANNAAIRERLKGLQDSYVQALGRKITLHEKGLWSSDTVLKFNPGFTIDDFETGTPGHPLGAHLVDSGLSSHIYEKETELNVSVDVPVTTIDNATQGEATFLKFEIEGSELNALHGAKETIRRNRPKMAISIYHKPEDLETLTGFVLETGQDYKMGFRQHNPLLPDAMVLYCY